MLKAGSKAPAFNLPADDGTSVALKDLKGQQVILFFYPKDMTSGCTVEARGFQAELSKFTRKGAVILGISKDSVASHQKFKEKEGLTYRLLSDKDGDTCEAYGVWVEKSMYGRKYMGIERTTFLIDAEGKIEKIFPKVKVEGHCGEVLTSL